MIFFFFVLFSPGKVFRQVLIILVGKDKKLNSLFDFIFLFFVLGDWTRPRKLSQINN